MLFGLLPLLVLGAIVVLIVRAVRSGGHGPRDAGPVMLRRFFQYATLYGVLIVVAIGFTGLLEQLLGSGGDVVRRGSTDAARAISFVVVGVPVYLGIGAWVNRGLDDERERRSFGLSFYFTATLITALLVAGYAAFEVLTWAFGVADFDEASLARGLVWGVIGVVHWFLIDRFLEERGEGHILAGSALSLGHLGTAIGFGLFTILDGLYFNVFETGVANSFGDDLLTALAGVVVAGALWWIYWLRNGIHLERTVLWNAYTLLLGVFSGLSAAIGTAAGILYLVLVWLVGDPDPSRASRFFEPIPALISVIVLGGLFFFYHRAVLAEAGPRRRTEIRRVYEYVIAGLGLLSFAAGITVLILVIIQQIMPSGRIIETDSDINVVLGSITLLVTGGPLWFGFWRRIQRHRYEQPQSELRSRTRRAYLALLFGLGGVAALISLVVAVFSILEDLLDGNFGAGTINDVAPALAIVLTTGAISGYHWVVFREDRAETPAAITSPLREVILLGITAPGALAELAEELDVRVRFWDRVDEVPAPLDAARLAEELADTTHERVLVMAAPGGHEIVPFAERG